MSNFPDGYHSLDDPANRPVYCRVCGDEIGDHDEAHESVEGGLVCDDCWEYDEDEEGSLAEGAGVAADEPETE